MSATLVDPFFSPPEARILFLAPEGKSLFQNEAWQCNPGAHASMQATALAEAASLLRRHTFDIVVAYVDSEFSDGLRLPSILKEFRAAGASHIPQVLWTACAAPPVHPATTANCAASSDTADREQNAFGSASLVTLESLARLARATGLRVSIANTVTVDGLRSAIEQLLGAPHGAECHGTRGEARMPTEDDVIGALTSGEGMRVVFQPQFDLQDRRMVGAEALIRWRHARLGDIAPAAFLPIVNRLGLDLLLFSFIERQAIGMLTQLREAGVDMPLSVNASPKTLCAPGLAERLALRMRRTGLPTDRLVIELTEESTDFDVLQLSASIAALRTRGFQVSLDDFGSGSASLALLSHTPFDELKIDGALVRACLSAPRSCRVISGIVDLARAMDLRLVAEGIEDTQAIDMLLRLGCRLGQGFALARPLETSDFLRRAVSKDLESGNAAGKPVGA